LRNRKVWGENQKNCEDLGGGNNHGCGIGRVSAFGSLTLQILKGDWLVRLSFLEYLPLFWAKTIKMGTIENRNAIGKISRINRVPFIK
jgi:hypothetical protein